MRAPRYALWSRTLAGIVVASGLGAAVTAPAKVFTGADDPGFETEESPGIALGPALVKPSVSAGDTFDSNVFAAPNHERADVFASLRPAVEITAAGPQRALDLRAEGEFRHYATYSRENIANGRVSGAGRFDFAPDAYLVAGGGYQLLHEDRGALVPVNGISPTQFTVVSGRAGLVVEPAPIGLRLDATADSYGYDNVRLFNGALAEETARDRVVYAVAPRLIYRWAPNYDLFLHAAANRRQYNSTREPDGLDRSSTGYAADLGAAMHLPGFAVGEAYLGFLEQKYDMRLAGSIGAIDFGGSLEWHPGRGATALRFAVRRSVEETPILGSPGYLQTAIRLAAEHRLLPKLLLVGSAGYINADFAGGSGNSDLYELVVGARYSLAANLSAGVEYDFDRRASSAALPSYTRHILEVRVRGQL